MALIELKVVPDHRVFHAGVRVDGRPVVLNNGKGQIEVENSDIHRLEIFLSGTPGATLAYELHHREALLVVDRLAIPVGTSIFSFVRHFKIPQ